MSLWSIAKLTFDHTCSGLEGALSIGKLSGRRTSIDREKICTPFAAPAGGRVPAQDAGAQRAPSSQERQDAQATWSVRGFALNGVPVA